MGMKKIVFTICFLLYFTGCTHKSNVCPIYPKPNQTVLNKIQLLNDNDVDNWMMKQMKLFKKLKVCNE